MIIKREAVSHSSVMHDTIRPHICHAGRTGMYLSVRGITLVYHLPNVLRLRNVGARSSKKEREITALFILDLKSHTIFHITRTPLKLR